MCEVTPMAELKPCPFCGGKAGLISIKAFEWCDYSYIARCENPNCEVSPGVKKLEKKEAIEAWNRRAGDGK
jgi:Lar family restriction alleviation protein